MNNKLKHNPTVVYKLTEDEITKSLDEMGIDLNGQELEYLYQTVSDAISENLWRTVEISLEAIGFDLLPEDLS